MGRLGHHWPALAFFWLELCKDSLFSVQILEVHSHTSWAFSKSLSKRTYIIERRSSPRFPHWPLFKVEQKWETSFERLYSEEPFLKESSVWHGKRLCVTKPCGQMCSVHTINLSWRELTARAALLPGDLQPTCGFIVILAGLAWPVLGSSFCTVFSCLSACVLAGCWMKKTCSLKALNLFLQCHVEQVTSSQLQVSRGEFQLC